MRASLLSALPLLLGAALPAAAQDPLPLRPGSPGIVLYEEVGSTTVKSVVDESPAWRAGIREEMRVLAVDGRAFDFGDVQEAALALAGPIGEVVEVTVAPEQPGDRRTVRLVREDLLAPGPGYTEVVASPHFVVHHLPGEAHRDAAVRVSRRAERLYARQWGGMGGGHRGHLYLVERAPGPHGYRPSFFVARVAADDAEELHAGGPAAYAALGPAGAMGAQLSRGLQQYPLGRTPGEVHREVARELVSDGRAPFQFTYHGDSGVSVSISCGDCGAIWASVVAYIRERYGTEGLARVWRGNDSFLFARGRVLGVFPSQLLDGWYRHVLALGPRPGAGPGAAGAAAVLGWGALVLAAGVWLARRKEAG